MKTSTHQTLDFDEWRTRRAVHTPGEIVLAPHTSTEAGLLLLGSVIGAVSVLAALAALHERQPAVFAAGIFVFVLGAVLVWIGYTLSDRYLLDLNTRKILFSRRFLGRHLRKTICEFSDLVCVAESPTRESGNENVGGEWESHWLFGLVLVTRSGRMMRVIDPHPDKPSVERMGESLASELGVEFVRAEEDCVLEIHPGDQSSMVRYRKLAHV